MGRVIYSGGRFLYCGDDGEQRLLLNALDVYGNHSHVSMVELVPAYEEETGEEKGLFFRTLMEHVKALDGEGRLGYVMVLLLMVRMLWRKQRALHVLRVGGSAVDSLSMHLSEVLEEFDAGSWLYCVSADKAVSTRGNVLTIHGDPRRLPSTGGPRFDVLLLEEEPGGLPRETVRGLLPLLRPFGWFFCMAGEAEVMQACREAVPGMERLHAEGNRWLLTGELSHDAWETAWRVSPQGRLAMKKDELGKRMELLRDQVAGLEFLGRDAGDRLLREAKWLEILLAEVYSSLASVDAKMLAAQFREALIDWRLGNAETERVKRSFAALRADLRRYHDMGIGREWYD